MGTLLLFLPGLIVGIFVYVLVHAHQEAHKRRTNTMKEFKVICFVPWEMGVQRKKNKEKILNLLQERRKLTYATIRRELGFSSVVMDYFIKKLEEEGEIKQAGRNDHAVFYSIKE
ncbi:MAG: hypothetical protein WDZ39_00135 [Candidatus Spechtbacterales bacterium]